MVIILTIQQRLAIYAIQDALSVLDHNLLNAFHAKWTSQYNITYSTKVVKVLVLMECMLIHFYSNAKIVLVFVEHAKVLQKIV